MSFKKGFSKAAPSAAPKHGASLTLSGFSFKQLEEDEEEEDLTAFTGKYEKQVEESHKKNHERTSSNSSISSISSVPEIKAAEKPSSAAATDFTKIPLKMSSSLPTDNTSSPVRNAAKNKFETSKELFSGLKGKITDKIVRKIEEYSGDSSSSPSPEKEIKPLPVQRSNSLDPVDKETATVINSSLTLEQSKCEKGSNVVKEIHDMLSSASVESDKSLSSKDVTIVKDISSSTERKKSNSTPPVRENVSVLLSSGPIEDHPLVRSENDDDFEDVIEPEDGLFPQIKHSSIDENSEFFDLVNEDKGSKILVFEEHFTSEPAEDFTGHPAFMTSTQLKPRSKIQRLIKKKEPKTSAVATMSALHYTPDEEIAAAFDTIPSKPQEEDKKKHFEKSLTVTDKLDTVKSESSSTTILRQFNLDNRALPFQKMCMVAVILFAYLIMPLPSYLSGFTMGVLLASITWALYLSLLEPRKKAELVILPPIVEESFSMPEMKTTTEIQEFLYKGWMNELTDYNADDYHINKTHCVFISLEETHLRLQRPKNPVPKRAMWDEVLPKSQFIHQRHFDLNGSSVYLLPKGLVKKRIWSKKYPICIALPIKGSAQEESKIKHISSEPIIGTKKDKISDLGFEIITEDKCDHNILYLFARTGREKEEWFKRFAAAAVGKPLGNHVLDMRRAVSHNLTPQKKSSESIPRHKREGSTDSVGSSSSLSDMPSDVVVQKETEAVDLLTFAHYMGRLMPSGALNFASSPSHTTTVKDIAKDLGSKEANKSSDTKEVEETKVLNPNGPIICDSQLFWINALIGRCFFDFLRDKWWISKVTEKLQRKLSKIHVPYFIEELQVTDINMGYEIPGIRHAGKPYIDEKGFWIDLSITYSGGFQMTIETKMNLMKLKKTHHSSHPSHSVDSTKSPITDSDEEDSAESSTDEEEEAPTSTEESSSGGGASRKLLRYLNKITQSKYFQQATEYKVIKRAMENVSNTPLTLTVTVNSLVGKLALNIPPPPSDRLWYGFRGNPQLRLSAKPQVGERAVTITHVVEWIEKKLAIEFQRVFVMPNMDDLLIPILVPGEVNGVQLSHSISL